MSKTKLSNEGRVNIALGAVKLAELAKLAKKNSTSRGALGRALILQGIDRINSGEIQVAAGVNLNAKQP